jgi:ATP-dependent Zn protease
MTSAYRETDVASVLQHLGRLAVGATGADVERAVRVARAVARRGQRPMALADLEGALKDGRPQLIGPLRRRMAIHEAGHAVAAIALNLGTVVSVIIDGIHGGTTTVRPNPDRDQDEAWLNDQLCFTMAGRAAELVFMGSVGGGSGAGAASDLEHATRVASEMEGRLGYGAVNPLIYLTDDAIRIRLLNDRDFVGRVHSRIAAAEARAVELVLHLRETVDRAADILLASGAIEVDAMRRLCLEGAR